METGKPVRITPGKIWYVSSKGELECTSVEAEVTLSLLFGIFGFNI
jgi:hypothetical protein